MLGGSIAAVARWRLPPAPYGEDAKLGLSRLRRRGKMGARRASRFTPRQRCSLGVGTPQPRTKRVTSRYYNLWVVTKARHKSFIHNNLRRLGEWCNGSTSDSGSLSLGSNPSSPARLAAIERLPTRSVVRPPCQGESWDTPYWHARSFRSRALRSEDRQESKHHSADVRLSCPRRS